MVYAYGCYYESDCFLPGGSPPWFFASDGTYDIYDYRNPGELRINVLSQALVMGSLKTGVVTHDVAFGGSAFRRSVEMPSTAVYDYVGSENIYQPNQAFPIELVDGKPDKAGPRVLYEDNHQSAMMLQDRVHLPGRIQLTAGGRLDSVRDHNFAGTDAEGNSPLITNRTIWLPQYSVAWHPKQSLSRVPAVPPAA